LLFVVVLLCIVIFTPIKEAQPLVHFQKEVRQQVDTWINNDLNGNDKSLSVPRKQEFALNNIQMNMSKKTVESELGKEKRITSNEYGT
ncbi:CAP domain-containing protein, partial [Staphylococcus simulans]